MKLSLLPLLSILALSLAAPLPTTHLLPRQTPLNAFLTVLLDFLPVLDGTIEAVAGILTTFEAFLAALTHEPVTYNELGSQACTPYTVIFARGTTEPGNVGILVGPPFFDALTAKFGAASLTIQGVNNYTASVGGYVEGGEPSGGYTMAKQIKQAKTLCPNTKLVASGYSQGGQIVHNAIGQLDAVTASWISKVVMFGDPDNGKALPNVAANKVMTYCNADDNICVNGDLVLPAHLIYGQNAEAAAAFVAS